MHILETQTHTPMFNYGLYEHDEVMRSLDIEIAELDVRLKDDALKTAEFKENFEPELNIFHGQQFKRLLNEYRGCKEAGYYRAAWLLETAMLENLDRANGMQGVW